MGEDRGTLVRTSGASVEYSTQRVWATDLKNATMVHFTAPKRMLNKSAACHVAGLRKLALFPMELGNKSLNVSHGIWDRGIYTAVFRLFCQQHHRAVEGQLQTMPLGRPRCSASSLGRSGTGAQTMAVMARSIGLLPRRWTTVAS